MLRCTHTLQVFKSLRPTERQGWNKTVALSDFQQPELFYRLQKKWFVVFASEIKCLIRETEGNINLVSYIRTFLYLAECTATGYVAADQINDDQCQLIRPAVKHPKSRVCEDVAIFVNKLHI